MKSRQARKRLPLLYSVDIDATKHSDLSPINLKGQQLLLMQWHRYHLY